MEELLKILGANNPFNDNGDLTSDGSEAYEKLIQIVSILYYIGAITKTPDQIESYFDEIIRLGF